MTTLLTEPELHRHTTTAEALAAGLDRVVLGQQTLVRQVLTGLLSGGHVLLEGLPGLGKTELVKGLAALSGLHHSRIQFTPDLLPGDITGSQVLEDTPGGGRRLVFRPGPVFAQLVLADEINRASPKTQSALLQAMQEHLVTVLDQTHVLPKPFFVLATQNPVEMDGTYPLPEAQLDRFAIKATVTGVDEATLARILLERPEGRPATPPALTDAAGIIDLLTAVRRIVLPAAVAGYIARLVQATRPELPGVDPTVKNHVRWGVSPRGALALAAAARASALLQGRPAVAFSDVKALALPVLGHRLILGYEAGLDGVGAAQILAGLLERVPELAG